MMKKTLIALAVASTAVAAGANAGELINQDGTTLSIGGRAEARLQMTDGNADDQSRVRLNVQGTQELSDGLYGVGFYEAEYATNDQANEDNRETRYLYAGIGSQAGLITYGKNDGALGVITDFTDIQDFHGAAASSKLATADRMDNMLTYSAALDDLSLRAAYRFADTTTTGTGVNQDVDNNDANGYSASAIYAIGDTGVAVGAGYAFEGEKAGAPVTDGGDVNQYMLTASYTYENAYVAALYTDKDYDRNANDYKGYELAASYSIDKTQLLMTYGYGEVDSDKSVDSLALEAAYKFQPNFKAYVEYNFNMLDKQEATSKAAAADDAVVGLFYSF